MTIYNRAIHLPISNQQSQQLKDAHSRLSQLLQALHDHLPHCYDSSPLLRPLSSTTCGTRPSTPSTSTETPATTSVTWKASHRSLALRARAKELADNAFNHQLLNFRSRISTFLHWRLRHLSKQDQNKDVNLILRALYSLNPNSPTFTSPASAALHAEITSKIEALPWVHWPGESFLPLKESSNDQRKIPALLHLFRWFDAEYRADPSIPPLPTTPVPRVFLSRRERKRLAKEKAHQASNKMDVDPEPTSSTSPAPASSHPPGFLKAIHWSLFPLPSLQGVFIEIDHLALHDLIKRLPQELQKHFRNFVPTSDDADKRLLFDEVFFYPAEDDRKRNRTKLVKWPAAGIKTDGTSIRLVMRDPSREPSKNSPLSAKDLFSASIQQVKDIQHTCDRTTDSIQVIGLDPGRKCPVTCVNVTSTHRLRARRPCRPRLRSRPNVPHPLFQLRRNYHYVLRGKRSIYRSFSLSNAEYRDRSWSTRHQQLQSRRQGSNARVKLDMNKIPTARSTSTAALNLHISYILPKLRKTLLPFSITSKTKSWHFRALRGLQSALAWIVSKILGTCHTSTPPKAVVVAYGAAKFDPSARKRPCPQCAHCAGPFSPWQGHRGAH